jgi:alkanesulfonate monooxygenase SsuD/methylene tetrahydromethanopterin reductase-like flavin-dependent oxidoreductase (luciferase family)
MTTLGIVFVPSLPPERLRSVAVAAEESGLEELWLWEDCFREGGIATAAAVLAWTDLLRVGVVLLPVPLRNVALLAMELASLERMFPGRAIAGIGHGVQSWMGQVGARVESPMTLLREYADALRGLMAGESVTVDGRYVHLDEVRLDWPPAATTVPLHAGALGPRSIRLCGELADGTIIAGGTTPDELREATALVGEGRALSGRSGPHRVTTYLMAATGQDAQARLDAEIAREGFTARSEDLSVAGSPSRWLPACSVGSRRAPMR